VRKLWHSACVKLGANNKCHAIALAIRRKII
jgi:DNA-binding CsgD family transcriptional regulator